MRRLAGVLGAGAMAPYRSMANKDELVDATIDIVSGEIELPPEDVDWKQAMRWGAPSGR